MISYLKEAWLGLTIVSFMLYSVYVILKYSYLIYGQ